MQQVNRKLSRIVSYDSNLPQNHRENHENLCRKDLAGIGQGLRQVPATRSRRRGYRMNGGMSAWALFGQATGCLKWSLLDQQRTNWILAGAGLSASLIGRSGSSTFRLSTATVSMSLAGSCFSSESAPRPFHHGIRGRGGTIFWAALPSDERRVQADKRTHLIHRPARDIIPPRGGARVFSYRI